MGSTLGLNALAESGGGCNDGLRRDEAHLEGLHVSHEKEQSAWTDYVIDVMRAEDFACWATAMLLDGFDAAEWERCRSGWDGAPADPRRGLGFYARAMTPTGVFGAAEALQAAQRDMLERRRQSLGEGRPHDWGAFTISGVARAAPRR